MAKNHLYNITGPSGAGKTSVALKLINRLDNALFMPTVTTRGMRNNERDGVEHYFIKHDEFLQAKRERNVAVIFKMYGKLYGIYKSNNNIAENILKAQKNNSRIIAPTYQSIDSNLENGKDVFVILGGYKGFIRLGRKYSEYAIPLLVDAPDEGLERNIFMNKHLGEDQRDERLRHHHHYLRQFRDNMNQYKYRIFIDFPIDPKTDKRTQDQIDFFDILNAVNKLEAIVKRERAVDSAGLSFGDYHEAYINNIVQELFDVRDFSCILDNLKEKKKVKLNIDDETIRRYSEQKKIDEKTIKDKFLPKGVIVTAVAAYQLGTILLDKVETAYAIDKRSEKEVLLGLISERLSNYYYTSKDRYGGYNEFSQKGLVRVDGAQISDGIVYSLGDPVSSLKKDLPLHTLCIGFVNNQHTERVVRPLTQHELREYELFESSKLLSTRLFVRIVTNHMLV